MRTNTNRNINTQNFKKNHLEMVKQIQINDLVHNEKDVTILRHKTKSLVYLFGDDTKEGK